jgi:hypothetical protein
MKGVFVSALIHKRRNQRPQAPYVEIVLETGQHVGKTVRALAFSH